MHFARPAHVGVPAAGFQRSSRTASVGLLAAGVLAQIAYPLLGGDALRLATVCSVLLLATAGIVHAAAVWGRRAAVLLLIVAGGLGLAAETVGVHTGRPFGQYTYAGTLGPELAGVPVVVPLAWTMLAYPCLLLGRRLAPSGTARVRFLVTALAGGVGLTGWDLFLDPQMVAQGNWSWAHPLPALPGVPGVPLTNYAGWLLVSVLMIAALDRVLPIGPRSVESADPVEAWSTTRSTRSTNAGQARAAEPVQDRSSEPIGAGSAVLVERRAATGARLAGQSDPTWELTPAALLTWTWLGSTIGNLVFFGRPWVALYGGVAMGAVLLPYLSGLFRSARQRERAPATTREDGG